MLRLLRPSLLLLLFFPVAVAAQNQGADIFILSSHTESSEWAQQMLRPIEALAADRQDL